MCQKLRNNQKKSIKFDDCKAKYDKFTPIDCKIGDKKGGIC